MAIETYAWIYLYIRIGWGLIGLIAGLFVLRRLSGASGWLVRVLVILSSFWAGLFAIPILLDRPPVMQVHWLIFVVLWISSLLVGPAAFWMHFGSSGKAIPA